MKLLYCGINTTQSNIDRFISMTMKYRNKIVYNGSILDTDEYVTCQYGSQIGN